MKGPSSTPGKFKIMLAICLVGTIISMGISFLVYSASSNTAEILGRDTAPAIIASDKINALLADAHSNAMNAMVTNEKSGGRFWTEYRKDMEELHSQLLELSGGITYGTSEGEQMLEIMKNVGAYEYTLGGAVSDGAQISVDQFGEANRLMQQKILPASVALNKIYSSRFDSSYSMYIDNIGPAMALLIITGIIFIAILLFTQFYLFKKSRRVFNIGLLFSTILFTVSIIYSANVLNSVKSDIYGAKHDAFDSIQALWSARAVAYNANALESLYLLHDGTGIVQTADTINFNLSSSLLCSDTKEAGAGGKFEGYLSDELNNITFDGEKTTADNALKDWIKYVDVDRQIRNLEYDSRHDEAVSLNTGSSAEQSDGIFTEFDNELGKAIDINQSFFNSSMDNAFQRLEMFPYIALIFLVLIMLSCAFGLKPRIDEYKA